MPLSLAAARSGVDGEAGMTLSTLMEFVVAVPEFTAAKLFSSVPAPEPIKVRVPSPPVTVQL